MSGADDVYTDQLPGRTLAIEGEEYLFCSGTAYLGISSNEKFRQCLAEGFGYYGTNYSSSRNSNLQLRVFEEAEAYLASWTDAEAALTMSSGFMAGQLLVQVLKGTGRFIYAPGAHPAVWKATAEVPDVSQEYEEWVAQLVQTAPAMPEEHLIIVCNSLDPLRARNYHFSWVADLPKHKKITLVVDDSHGIGVTGTDGAGIFRQLSEMPGIRPVVASSLGKALGIPAGVILGDNVLIQELRTSPVFGGASPAIPAYLYAFLHCQEVFAEARQKLFANISYFHERLNRPELFSYFGQYPVFSTRYKELCPYLLRNKVLISSFRYPTPEDDPITRVILNSLHTSEDLQRLANLINQMEISPDSN